MLSRKVKKILYSSSFLMFSIGRKSGPFKKGIYSQEVNSGSRRNVRCQSLSTLEGTDSFLFLQYRCSSFETNFDNSDVTLIDFDMIITLINDDDIDVDSDSVFPQVP